MINNSNECNTNNCNIENGDLKIIYEDNSEGLSDFFTIRTKGFNNFKGFNCFYISNESVEISISHKGEVTFGPCYLLNRIKYNISDLPELLLKEKKVICTENRCDCGINLKKERNKLYDKIIKLEKLIDSNLDKYSLKVLVLKDISISLSLNKNISIKFFLNGYVITYFIHNKKSLFNFDGLGFDIEIKNNLNILFKVEKFKYEKKIVAQMLMLKKISNIYKMILK